MSVLTWVELSPAHAPSPRRDFGFAYDTARQKSVLYSQEFGNTNDTWEWDGTDWTEVLDGSVNSPPAHIGGTFLFPMSLAYHAASAKMVLIAGYVVGSVYTQFQTWTYDYTVPGWTHEAPTHTPPSIDHRQQIGLAAYPDNGTVVMFGGVKTPPAYLDETWTWDGTDWTQHFPASSPAGGPDPTMWYDASRSVVGVFDRVGNTWEWDGTNWTQRFPATSPGVSTPPPHLALCASLSTLLAFGAGLNTETADTWSYDSATPNWVLLAPTASPPARDSVEMVTENPTNSTVVLFGGSTASGSLLGDTWTLGTAEPGALNPYLIANFSTI
jgi:hypothetical protein